MPDKHVTRQAVMTEVLREFGLMRSELEQKRGKRTVTDAKRVYAYLCNKHLKDSLIRIGMELKIGHSSVINLITSAEDFISINDPLARQIEKIESKLFKHNL